MFDHQDVKWYLPNDADGPRMQYNKLCLVLVQLKFVCNHPDLDFLHTICEFFESLVNIRRETRVKLRKNLYMNGCTYGIGGAGHPGNRALNDLHLCLCLIYPLPCASMSLVHSV